MHSSSTSPLQCTPNTVAKVISSPVPPTTERLSWSLLAEHNTWSCMLKVLGMLPGTEKHFVGWGRHCDGPITGSPGACGSAVVTSNCRGWIQQPEGSSTGFHLPESPLLQSCIVAHACQAATSARPSSPCLPGSPSYVLLPLHLLHPYLHYSAPSLRMLLWGMILPPGIPVSFSSPVILFGCIFFPELLLHVFPHTRLSCKL